MIKEGKVKWFDTAQGYGFLEPEDGEDIFLHYRDLKDKDHSWIDPPAGSRMKVEVHYQDEGPRAVKIIELEEDSNNG